MIPSVISTFRSHILVPFIISNISLQNATIIEVSYELDSFNNPSATTIVAGS